MLSTSTPMLCSACKQAPAVMQAVHRTEDGNQQRILLCEECLAASPFAMGAVLARLMGGVIEAPQTVAGPVSHPQASPELSAVIADAMAVADANAHAYTDPRHLLGALLRSIPGRGALARAGLRGDIDRFAAGYSDHVVKIDTPHRDAPTLVRPEPGAVAALLHAVQSAAKERSSQVEARHLIAGLTADPNDAVSRLLRDAGVNVVGVDTPEPATQAPTPALDAFGRDLTAEARDGKIDPVIGRAEEIERVVRILARRRKNNPVLIGQPGVGKTAIVEGLALRIVNDQVPETLRGRRVIALDVAGLVAGATMRGQFEQRLKVALEEVTASDGQIILFIDELHMIVGAGSAEGSMDAANILKPALARGEMQTIGATTLDEYRRIERDGALARRFQPVTVQEPDVTDTIAILRGLKEGYEAHHRARFSDDALVAAAKLSDRYLSEFHQPDKAIDLLDEAGALVRLRHLQPDEHTAVLRAELDALRVDKDTAAAQEDFQRAAQAKARIDELSAALAAQPIGADSPEVLEISAGDIALVVSDKTGILVGDLMEGDLDRLRGLEDSLHDRVVGQDRAVSAVADAVRRAQAGLANPDEPLGVFAFLGPTGVGKTELAKALAERVMGTPDALVRIDGSEYREAHSVSRLVSAPPGYVGYGKGGQLTEPVRRRPYSVVLIDEIEKMHPDVWNVLLQVMDDGRLTDGEGRTADFRHAIVILTSNVGAGRAQRPVGFAAGSDAQADIDRVLAQAKRVFPPEFLNRIDDTIVFDALNAQQARLITRKLCDELAGRLADRGIVLDVSDDLVAQLAADGFDEEYGARPLRRHLRATLEKQITDAIIDGDLTDGGQITATLDSDGSAALTLSAAQPTVA